MQALGVPQIIPVKHSRKPFRTLLLILGAYYLLNILIIGLGGNFPLNDDWMYGLEVQRMLETGQLHLYGGSPASIVHVVAGAGLSKLFGFSFVNLRCLSLVFSFAGCVFLYAILRQLKVRSNDAILASFVLASNPLYVNLSFIYMTDIPAVTYTLLYLLLALVALRRLDWKLILASALSLVSAIAVRQNNLLLSICNALVAALMFRTNKIFSLSIVVSLVLLPLACGYYLDNLMTKINEFPGAYDWYKHEIQRILHMAVVDPYQFCFLEMVSAVRASAYLGLFVCPILAGLAAPSLLLRTRADEPVPTETLETVEHARRQDRRVALVGQVLRVDVSIYFFLSLLVTLAATICLVWFYRELMPFSANLLMIPSLGSQSIVGFENSRQTFTNISLTALSAVFCFVLLGAIACCVHRTIVLCWRTNKNANSKNQQRTNTSQRSNFQNQRLSRATSCALVVSLCGMTFAWAIFHITIANLDRYFLAPLALALPCVLLTARWLRKRVVTTITVTAAIAIALYSTCAERDYMEWNRVRWQAISELETAGVPARTIDGGIEYNYTRDPRLSNDLKLEAETFVNINKGSKVTSRYRWWSVPGERYIISLTAVPGYKTFKTYTYFSTLKLHRVNLFVLKQISE